MVKPVPPSLGVGTQRFSLFYTKNMEKQENRFEKSLPGTSFRKKHIARTHMHVQEGGILKSRPRPPQRMPWNRETGCFFLVS
jgi:hypothetical protein